MEQRERTLNAQVAAWRRRSEIARANGQVELAEAAARLAGYCGKLLESGSEIPEHLNQINVLRKRIEASEAHRTMSAEHGLNDEAIDTTYEIQELERELVSLVLAAGI